MQPDDDLTAALEEIQERAAWKDDPDRTAAAARGSAEDVPRLLAALRAVLELHHPVDRGTGPQCKGCATHITFTPWPCRTYRAISRELAGKGENDG